MSRKTKQNPNGDYPIITTFFSKSKHHQQNFNDKNQFIRNKFNGAIENIHAEPNQNEHTKIVGSNENPVQFPVNDIDDDDQTLILTGKIRSLEKDLKHAKILLRKASDLNLQKDLEIKRLKEQLKKKNLNERKSEILFGNFADRFESGEIKKIRSIKSGKRNDSAFVLTILKSLYKNEEEKLVDRRVTDRKYDGTKKNELSAEKKQMMREMLEERVLHELSSPQDEKELAERMNQLNRHMRNALHNSLVAHKKKSSQPNSTTVTMQPESNQLQNSQGCMQSHSVQPLHDFQYGQYSHYPYDQNSQYPYMQNYRTMPFPQHTHTSGYSSTPQNPMTPQNYQFF